MMNKYVPIIKMGDAELRGIERLTEEVKESITPVFELTRSRKTTKLKEGSISKRLDKLEKVFGTTRDFILDLTSDGPLINTEIKELQKSDRGYSNWCNFIFEQKRRFPKIIPVIQVSEDENLSVEDNNKNLFDQVVSLQQKFQMLCYRINISDEVYEEDLEVIRQALGGNCKSLICCMDVVFIPREKASAFAKKIIERISQINERFGVVMFSLAGTSFPKNVNQVSTHDSADIILEEVLFARIVREHFKEASEVQVIYGDYASINQERNDMIATGWIPRIDCPTNDLIFYYRKRRAGDSYIRRYMEVANMVTQDSRFQSLKQQISCWGIDEIEYAAGNRPRGLAPSFWISVRLNIHISLRSFLLNLSDRSNLPS